MAFFMLTSPVLVGGLVAFVGFPELALPAMVVSGLALYLFRRRAKTLPAATLRVEAGTLRVFGPGGREIIATPLHDLVDITLDVKTISMVQESPGPVPELMYVNSTVGPELDTSRIQLVTRSGDPIPLTVDHMPHSDSLEWRGKMRQFLRKHDWKPEEPEKPKLDPKKAKKALAEISDEPSSSHQISLPPRDTQR